MKDGRIGAGERIAIHAPNRLDPVAAAVAGPRRAPRI
jgi:hypothetical protein